VYACVARIAADDFWKQ